MAHKLLLTTINTTTIREFGDLTFTHPVIDYVLSDEFKQDEIYESDDLQKAVDVGDIIVKNNSTTITNIKDFFDNAGMPSQPYLIGNTNIALLDSMTDDVVLIGDNFDENCTVYLGDEVQINSVIANSTTQLTVNYTTTAILQGAVPVIVERNGATHFGDSITCEVTDVVLGTGPSGTFTTDFQTGTNSASWGTDWTLAIFGNVNSLDGYFVTSTAGTPSGTTGPTDSSVFTSDSQYMFTECSGSNNGSGQYGTAFTSNFRDLTQVDFEYHMFGTALGDFSLWSQNPDNTWTQRWLVNGQQQANQGDPALAISLNTTTWDCKAIEFRFASPTNNTGYSADIAIDDIVLTSV